jgi:hypothetical protein
MKYGESVFDILYLLFAIISGCLILYRAGNRTEKNMGLAALILGCGDAFHLIPRVTNYFSDRDLTAALGMGKLITSISMTVFYLLHASNVYLSSQVCFLSACMRKSPISAHAEIKDTGVYYE